MLDHTPHRQTSTLAQAWRSFEHWRARRRASPTWSLAVGVILAVIALPVVTIFYLALTPAENIWPKLMASVLPSAVRDTLLLMGLTAFAALVTGTGTAWLVIRRSCMRRSTYRPVLARRMRASITMCFVGMCI